MFTISGKMLINEGPGELWYHVKNSLFDQSATDKSSKQGL
jgi:hypothetical protein